MTRGCSVTTCKDDGPLIAVGIIVPGIADPMQIPVCSWHAPFVWAWQSMSNPIPGVDRRPAAVQRADAASMKKRRGGDLAVAHDTVKQAELDVRG